MSVYSHTPTPGLNADKEGDDEQEERTEEIAELKKLIDAMPGGTIHDVKSRVPHQTKLGQLEFQFHIFAEKKRLARALSKLEEMYGDLHSEPCLMCLEDIHVHAASSVRKIFICCGGFICEVCVRNMDKSGLGLDKCPLCRESFAASSEAEDDAKVMTLAKRGNSWAQREAGSLMIHGRKGYDKQKLEWLKKAAAQDYPPALFELSAVHRDGLKSLVRKSQEKANKLLLKAANLGYAKANSLLATYHTSGTKGFEENTDEAYFRASVALALDNENGQAAFILGTNHHIEKCSEPSPYLACHYLNIAANENGEGLAFCFYSQTLCKLNEHLYGGQISGHNAMPAAFFWLRKSSERGIKTASRLLKEWETNGQNFCANCGMVAQAGEKFKQCSKCKAQWYCSKECQVEAWREGHKKDCKRATILKFQDYLSAE
ncbi:hypothetical protein THAOC_23842 [Thalassiosira oceanica]|uniref:MYND-type domain-containing protein n=1 Tax=Thalassiosira oceanica TaxID=159749 RepID=K0RRA9_THAOC|nr:hypothetical protein THAOC_23842 [Thalassiosira oceanica]|eukprot:EJK56308.1 hypothetical protein THAOC_23842 [Thalassiosira oceanica]